MSEQLALQTPEIELIITAPAAESPSTIPLQRPSSTPLPSVSTPTPTRELEIEAQNKANGVPTRGSVLSQEGLSIVGATPVSKRAVAPSPSSRVLAPH